jgi:hypothetical protein
MPKSRLSTIDQVLLTLGCLVFFAVAISISGFMAGAETRAKLTAFASEGVVVMGTVTGKNINVVGKGKTWVHWLDVTFTTGDGVSHSHSANVANTLYDRYGVGSPVQITYVKSRPEWFYVPGGEPTQRDAAIFDGMLLYGALAAILCAVGLVGVVFHRRGAEPPTAGTAIPERVGRGNGLGSSGSRAQFGTRRA